MRNIGVSIVVDVLAIELRREGVRASAGCGADRDACGAEWSQGG
jgi:hypothetical protein